MNISVFKLRHNVFTHWRHTAIYQLQLQKVTFTTFKLNTWEMFTERRTVGNHFGFPTITLCLKYFPQSNWELLSVGAASCSHMFSTKLASTIVLSQRLSPDAHSITQLFNVRLRGISNEWWLPINRTTPVTYSPTNKAVTCSYTCFYSCIWAETYQWINKS